MQLRSPVPDGRSNPMWSRFGLTLTPLLILSACSFDPPPDVPGDDDDAPIDGAPEPDVMPVECEANTTACDDAMGRYIECGPDGISTRVVECPLGCATDAE